MLRCVDGGALSICAVFTAPFRDLRASNVLVLFSHDHEELMRVLVFSPMKTKTYVII